MSTQVSVGWSKSIRCLVLALIVVASGELPSAKAAPLFAARFLSFDGDGIPDLVVGGGGGISLMPGHANGTFGPSHGLILPGAPNSVALGDLNRDGKLDIVTADFNSGNVSVLLGNGDGTFSARTDYPA